ncbi:MAG TPA: dipeptide epimerase [Steroidobacteraceae bacterium]|nr:dipeptide epimerase [Steroidobacteraceae bacterium]
MPALQLTIEVERLEFSAPFRIAGFLFEHQDAVVVTLDDGRHRGRGEACGVYYLDDDVEQMVAALEGCRATIESGVDRAAVQQILPPGGARNALDCALWELDARRAARPVWQIAGIDRPQPLVTTFTLGAEDPPAMAQAARKWAQAQALKVKLTGERELDIERVKAVRAARPEVWLGVDANQAYTVANMGVLLHALVEANVAQLEQPVARGAEAGLETFDSPIPLIADESALGLADLAGLVGRFDGVNIKLDKCGGLTEGLAMVREARRLGLATMVGNMMGSSLAMAPAFIIGQLCDVVDLDGPTFLRNDRKPSVRYTDGMIWVDEAVWGRALPEQRG